MVTVEAPHDAEYYGYDRNWTDELGNTPNTGVHWKVVK